MKKTIVVVLFLILALPISARADIEQPQNVPQTEKFKLRGEASTPCGILRLFTLRVTNTEMWSKRFLGDNAHPLVLRHTLLSPDGAIETEKIWLDQNKDGIFDEVFSDGAAVLKKYPTPCDAVL